jgi:hypothetical protein
MGAHGPGVPYGSLGIQFSTQAEPMVGCGDLAQVTRTA